MNTANMEVLIINKCRFWNYIISFVKEERINMDEDFGDLSSEQLRALFTSYCLIFDILVDTAECDASLSDIFDLTDIDEHGEKDFNDFMLSFLV